MRRSDREVEDFEDILDIVSRADTVHLGLFDGEYPYVVPLSYGFEVEDGKIILYVHGAKDGKKHDIIAQNAHVCAEMSICHGFAGTGNSVTCEYESVIGYGKAEKVFGAEAEHGVNLLLRHCDFAGEEYDKSILDMVTIYRITLKKFTGKKHFVK